MLALTLPDSFRLRINFTSGFVFDILNGWDQLMALPVDEKLRRLRDPATRAEWDRLAQSTGRFGAGDRQLGGLRAPRDVHRPRPSRSRAASSATIATELGKSAWDTMADMAVADGLRTVFANQDRGQDDATWRRRVEVWRDARAVIGASDAGAHLDMIDSFSFSTTLLAKAVREHDLMPVEEAVHHLTDGRPRCTASAIGAGWPRGSPPTSSCSTRRPSARARWRCGSTCPAAPAGCTAGRSASSTSSSTACRAWTARRCSTPAPGGCCARARHRHCDRPLQKPLDTDPCHYGMNRVMTADRPPTVDLRTAHRDDTRRVILEAFLELLDDESPLTISMPEVAAKAGVSVRTLYRYFPNKDALLEGANEWFSTRAQQMIGSRMLGLDDLAVYLENVWTAFSENVAAVRVQHTSAGGREFRARRTESTRQTVDEALPDEIPADRRGDVVDLIAALASSSMFFELVERFGHSPASAAALSTHLIHLLVDSEVDAAERSRP